jgi:hypothetical protein
MSLPAVGSFTSHMNDPEFSRTLAATRLVATFGLGIDEHRKPVSVGTAEWRRFLSAVVAGRLTGLAVVGLEAGWLCIESRQAHELVRRHREAMLWALTLERALLHITSALEAARIDSIILKGPAMAHTFYPEPSWRSFGDVDLLVRTQDWAATCSVLEDLGYRRPRPQARPGFDERFGKAAVHREAGGLEIDLHRTLVAGPFGLWIHPEGLFERTERFMLGGRSLRRLEDTCLFLHACLHASLGNRPPLLLPLRDVAQILRADAVDWQLLQRLATEWRLTAVVQDALRRVADTLWLELPVEASPFLSAEPCGVERRALRAYTSAQRMRGGPAIATIHAIPGIRSKVAYVWALLCPSRAFMERRTGERSSLSYVRRWMIPTRWLFGRRAVERGPTKEKA